jgi:hypothetical protein
LERIRAATQFFSASHDKCAQCQSNLLPWALEIRDNKKQGTLFALRNAPNDYQDAASEIKVLYLWLVVLVTQMIEFTAYKGVYAKSLHCWK